LPPNVDCGLKFYVLFAGICAQEVHLCGEESGIEFIRHIAMVTGDDMEVRKYKRLTSLTVLDRAVGEILALVLSTLIVIFLMFVYRIVVKPQLNTQ